MSFLSTVPYTGKTLEIFLNLMWLGLSVALAAWWLCAILRGDSKAAWSTIVAVGLLILLLFPVISMTDDLIAMSAPAETEQARRHEAPPLHSTPLLMLGGIALLGFPLLGLVLCAIAAFLLRPCGFADRLRRGFVRAMGVRPPPFHLLAA
jgi:hypothetical protein